MIARLQNWYLALSRREQILVGVAAGLAAIVLAGGIAVALTNAVDVKRTAYFDALERRARIEARALALTNAAKAPPVAIAVSGPLDLAISQSAAERGFTLDKSEASGNDRASVIIGQARPTALFGWISELEGQSVIVDEITMRPGTNGTVSVTVTFARRGM